MKPDNSTELLKPGRTRPCKWTAVAACSALIAVFTATDGFAQNFRWQAKTSAPAETGFHDIVLNPEITGKLRIDLGDLRLYDSAGGEIPYLVYSEKPSAVSDLYNKYNVISSIRKDRVIKTLLHNPGKVTADNIIVSFKGISGNVKFSVKGSNDLKEWNPVIENYLWKPENHNTSMQIVDLPESGNEYYEIILETNPGETIQVSETGYYNFLNEALKYVETLKPVLHQVDTLKQTIVKISFPETQYIDRITVEVEGPGFYHRNAQICFARNDVYRGVKKTYYEQIRPVKLCSNCYNSVNLSYLPAKELYLVIENHDDKPLKIKSVKCEQLKHYMAAGLNKGEVYTLKFGNPKLPPPVYDIRFFSDSIPELLPQIYISECSLIPQAVVKENKYFWNNKYYMWGAIIAVSVVLLYFTVRVLRNTNIDNK